MKNISANEFEHLLIKHHACSPAKNWAAGKDLAEAWATCNRGDWMLWLLARYGNIPVKTIVQIAVDCAEPAMKFLPANETISQKCLETVRKWLKDEVTVVEVKAAADAAYAAAYTDAAYAAANAGAAAANAGAAAANAATASVAAAYAAAAYAAAAVANAAAASVAAAYAAASAAADHAASAAAAADISRQFSADICRKYITIEKSYYTVLDSKKEITL